MPSIAIIGAGGFVFPLVLARDMLCFPALQDSEFRLHDISLDRANNTLAGLNAIIDAHKLGATAFATEDRRKALDGADFVVVVFQIGGIDAFKWDVTIPREYGIDQAIGDTLGPGGIFRGLRTIGEMDRIADDMHELCPDALLIQYANPMSINCWATTELGIETVGLCHSVQGTSRMLASQIGVPYEEITYDCAGVNHTSWFTTFRRGEEDLLPLVYETMIERYIEGSGGVGAKHHSESIHGDESRYQGSQEAVRTELMRLTGYFHTESSHHASEYWAWFRKDPETTLRYLPNPWYYYEESTNFDEVDRVGQIVERAVQPDGLKPSEEYGSLIVDSMTSGELRVIYGNVPNDGLITNLPRDACVEVACAVDSKGVRPIHYGELPLRCAALNTLQINVQRLAVHGGLTGDPELVHAAVALDPLTMSKLTLPEIREMVDRMLDAEREWLPQFS